MSGNPGGYAGSNYNNRATAGPTRSFEERAAAKDAMMQSLRDSSQQDRRVYVGNLSYDVKWHHLKDFMRQGEYLFHFLAVHSIAIHKGPVGSLWMFLSINGVIH